jgi:hypothetical protein
MRGNCGIQKRAGGMTRQQSRKTLEPTLVPEGFSTTGLMLSPEHFSNALSDTVVTELEIKRLPVRLEHW